MLCASYLRYLRVIRYFSAWPDELFLHQQTTNKVLIFLIIWHSTEFRKEKDETQGRYSLLNSFKYNM